MSEGSGQFDPPALGSRPELDPAPSCPQAAGRDRLAVLRAARLKRLGRVKQVPKRWPENNQGLGRHKDERD